MVKPKPPPPNNLTSFFFLQPGHLVRGGSLND
jgi:hypothetical protein